MENENIDLPDLGNLGVKTDQELIKLASEKEIKKIPLRRSDLIIELLGIAAEETGQLVGAGILDILHDGYGFLRTPGRQSTSDDVYVSHSQIRRFGLRTGDLVAGQVRPPREGEKYYGLLRVEIVNGIDPERAMNRPKFEKLTSVYPDKQFITESDPKLLSTRIIDIVSPIGQGQRSLIVAPPKAGKTILLKQIAQGISENSPSTYIIVALIGERPEEVTDMKRSIKGEIYSSTFDEPVQDHCRTAEDAIERAKRLVENGENVVVLLDSLTRLARAYNLALPSSGKTLSGGMDPVALYPPKSFFGAARNCEEAGSLTIIATALIDTGSRLDDLIYEEFKGTGNMELHLDRSMAERRIWPAINIERSGTRHEELLQDQETLKQVWLLRRMMAILGNDENNPTEAGERILERLSKTKSNKEFLASITKPEKK
ncbi:MAG: transcription termination factor Rho [Chloroflexi bacterium]|nr:transcription termination factor Rho [Chloroflexota bacterium]